MLATARKRPVDPIELRAIVDLEQRGWSKEDICRHLQISLRTYYRRKAELRRIADAAGR